MRSNNLPKVKIKLPAPKMKLPLDKQWEVKFKDEIYYCGEVCHCDGGITQAFELESSIFENLITKYIKTKKIEISAKKGKILIEEIDE
jgi:hypothetical protein